MLKIIYNIVKRKGLVQNNKDQCIYCGKCEKLCPYHTLSVDTRVKEWHISDERCMRCEKCIRNCPAKSLYLLKRD